MPSCFVTMPYGTHTLPDGRPLDFNQVYQRLVLPAAQRAGLDCRRSVDVETGSLWQQSLLSWLIASDVVVADLSTHNPNVLYELGVRHALRRGRTLLIGAAGRPVPGDLAALRVLSYPLQADGRIAEADAQAFGAQFQHWLDQRDGAALQPDSPLFSYFPGLRVQLPEALRPATGLAEGPEGVAPTAADDGAGAAGDRSGAGRAEAPDAEAYLAQLRRARNLSDWDRVVALAEAAPAALRRLPALRQQQALALNRRARPGDAERAIALMEALVAETGGGDAETHGVLGRIHKDRHAQALARGDLVAAARHLHAALDCYRRGFALDPDDFYTGINVVTLLQRQGDDAAQAELAQLLPRVRDAVQRRMDEERPDFWTLATALQLAAVARDWDAAAAAAQRALAQAPAGWMLETTLRELLTLDARLTGPDAAADRAALQRLAGRLRAGQADADRRAEPGHA